MQCREISLRPSRLRRVNQTPIKVVCVAMALKKKFFFADLVFTGKRLNGVQFHAISQASSNECKSASALIVVEQLPSPEVCLTADSMAIQNSSNLRTGFLPSVLNPRLSSIRVDGTGGFGSGSDGTETLFM